MKKGMTPRRSHKSAISSGTLSRRPRSSERASEQRPTILPSSYTGIAAAAGVSRRTCRVCHFDRPTAALSLDRSSVAFKKLGETLPVIGAGSAPLGRKN